MTHDEMDRLTAIPRLLKEVQWQLASKLYAFAEQCWRVNRVKWDIEIMVWTFSGDL